MAEREEDETEVPRPVKMKSKARHYVSAQGTSVDPDYLTTETTKKQDEQNDLKTKIIKKEDIKTERTKKEDIKKKRTRKEDQMTERTKKDGLKTETTEKEEPKPEITDRRDGSYEFLKSLWESQDLTLDPGGKVDYYWMGIVAIAVVYNCATVILRVTFSDLRQRPVYQWLFFFLDALFDLVYLLDILVQARTGYLHDGCLVPRLVQNYRKQSYFVTDIVAILPFHTLYNMFAGTLNSFNVFYFDVHPSQLVIPILRLVRLLKYDTVTRFFEITDSRTSNPNLLRAFKLSLYLWLVIHWIGCIYYMISEYEGLGSNEWVYTALKNNRLTRKYIRCMFWSMMTLTTIGERPPPETDLEYVFTGMIFLIGVFVFAAVVGNVGDVISNMHAARQDFQSRMDHIKFYMQHRRIPEELQERVKKWGEYSWSRTQATDEPALLRYLPDGLRTEIALHVHLNTLKKVKMFEECEEGLLRELVLKLRPQIFSPGDYICKIGEIGREMYILDHGKVEILVPNPFCSTNIQIAILTPGNYFGEISLLKLGKNRRTADVRAIGFSQILCLSRKDLLSALVEYPDAKAILEQQAKERMVQMMGVSSTNMGLDPGSQNVPDAVAEVIKQKGIQKVPLKGNERTELSELRQIINDLTAMKSQARSDKEESLSQKCQSLEAECKEKDAELLKRNNRIIQLETILKMTGALYDELDDDLLKTDSMNSVFKFKQTKFSDKQSERRSKLSTDSTCNKKTDSKLNESSNTVPSCSSDRLKDETESFGGLISACSSSSQMVNGESNETVIEVTPPLTSDSVDAPDAVEMTEQTSGHNLVEEDIVTSSDDSSDEENTNDVELT
ncbi:cyclic nucleotide-gated channel rod photoreceptor subunit alpha-like isoform X2 [Gigantopelta aegis]|uniref:cyclic nucleotide-gated channel rod photoreceptor subunit alpha-like isoform X2 n=1 Tax=Gigantopelta aegis TaxID=1735272 RepID=UPI001B88C90D|nr:cyclic nucleotide-gated channel rod photoreceptor subunit alpha-like isoform X2 [Gigantopelta aegis]